MKRNVILPATLFVLLAGAAVAVEPTMGAKLGTSIEDISAALAADGYTLTKYEREGNRIEVYAVKDSARHELYIDARSGDVIKTETSFRRGPASVPGMTDEQIRSSLGALGYEVTGFERERGQIEVYATQDVRRVELKIDPATGDIIDREIED